MSKTHPTPKFPGWQLVKPWTGPGTLSGGVYTRKDGALVISALTLAEYPDGQGIGEQYHVSVSKRGHRPEQRVVREVLAHFGMMGAEEDNHHPGIARHFWRPLDPAHRVACQCKSDETVVRDGSYAWSNTTDGTCRGCDYELLSGQPCPIHHASNAGRAG